MWFLGPLLWSVVEGFFVGGLVGGLVGVTVCGIIDAFTIKKEVKTKCPDAFKILILKKKKTAVDVGIFDKNEQPQQRMTIESSEGISEGLYEGQELYV